MSAPRIDCKVSLDSEEFRTRAAHNRALAEKLRADVAQAARGGTEKHRERHVSRGKLLPRERVERLLDGWPKCWSSRVIADAPSRRACPAAH